MNSKYELTCNPLDTYSEILMFLQNPPAWRSLCKELKPHSTYKIKNIETHKVDDVSRTVFDGPESFCHISPDAEEDKRIDDKFLPKTLVCHDMANGYHDDSIIDGTGNYDAYTFYNWGGIDIFCYFSHHLITIPPLGWINVGHEHGVKVIGTVITEWADGIEFWDGVLKSEEDYKNLASALVAIAKTLKFDGWLLNVENKISKPDVLLAFVKHLHTLLHQELNDPVLIWYDSVTVEGHLTWQNALNHKNRAFFDACDGLFTNYSWSPADVATSAREAGPRLTDLYIGIDVWGRNFYGGGQFNVQEAIEVAHTHGCSLAIFAPAWTHEALTTDSGDPNAVALAEDLERYEHFLLRDRALWGSVWRYLNTSLPCQLPFRTSFCRGQGVKRRQYGEVISPLPWFNLRHMQYQPNANHGTHGYLLSTIDNIVSASRTGVLKDPKGIIKYRASFLANNALASPGAEDLTTATESGVVPKADSTGEIPKCEDSTQESTSNEHATPEPTTHEQSTATKRPNEDTECKNNLKRKMKNVFKHLLRHRRKENDDQQAISDKESPAVEHAPEVIPGQSSKPDKEVNEVEVRHGQKSTPDDNRIENATDNNVQSGPTEQTKRKIQITEQEDKIVFTSEDQIAIQDLEDDDERMKETEADFTGRSMVQMSVNFKLKSKEERTRYGLAAVPDERQCLEAYFADSFVGGSCLRVNPSDEHARDHRFIRLLQCDFACVDRLVFCVVTKTLVGHEDQFLNVKVSLQRGSVTARVVLVGRDVPMAPHSAHAGVISTVAPLSVSPHLFRDTQKFILLNQPEFYVPTENSYDWKVRYYEIHYPESRVTSVNLDTGLSHGPILLGYLGICERKKAIIIESATSSDDIE